jgi:hypothetical protein
MGFRSNGAALTGRRAIRCDEQPRGNVVGGADPTLAVMERRIRAASREPRRGPNGALGQQTGGEGVWPKPYAALDFEAAPHFLYHPLGAL